MPYRIALQCRVCGGAMKNCRGDFAVLGDRAQDHWWCRWCMRVVMVKRIWSKGLVVEVWNNQTTASLSTRSRGNDPVSERSACRRDRVPEPSRGGPSIDLARMLARREPP